MYRLFKNKTIENKDKENSELRNGVLWLKWYQVVYQIKYMDNINFSPMKIFVHLSIHFVSLPLTLPSPLELEVGRPR